jgi:hypothetical protein
VNRKGEMKESFRHCSTQMENVWSSETRHS